MAVAGGVDPIVTPTTTIRAVTFSLRRGITTTGAGGAVTDLRWYQANATGPSARGHFYVETR